ncbi:hypothetical protein BC941DRAFT_421035 [Chlamydoabsidia padenii]|nr:hypothetical protein BC941DRAFT_421035 [Chlamydoabsidia padenii]
MSNDKTLPLENSRNEQSIPSEQATLSKVHTTDTEEDQLLKSMQALSTKDKPDDTMTDDDYILQCTSKPLTMEQVQTTFGKYESMRGGCRFQTIDDKTILVIFGHPSTAKRAWVENKNSSTVIVRNYQGPMDIIEGKANPSEYHG